MPPFYKTTQKQKKQYRSLFSLLRAHRELKALKFAISKIITTFVVHKYGLFGFTTH